VFVEAPTSLEALEELPHRVPASLVANLVPRRLLDPGPVVAATAS
jgi:hypothetical protein